jgi:hypothetical protein
LFAAIKAELERFVNDMFGLERFLLQPHFRHISLVALGTVSQLISKEGEKVIYFILFFFYLHFSLFFFFFYFFKMNILLDRWIL